MTALAPQPGLPPAGAPGQFLGVDATGSVWILRWHSRGEWTALGFEKAAGAEFPILRRGAELEQLIKLSAFVSDVAPLATPQPAEHAVRLAWDSNRERGGRIETLETGLREAQAWHRTQAERLALAALPDSVDHMRCQQHIEQAETIEDVLQGEGKGHV